MKKEPKYTWKLTQEEINIISVILENHNMAVETEVLKNLRERFAAAASK